MKPELLGIRRVMPQLPKWKPKDNAGGATVPAAHDPSRRIAPNMLTTDLSLCFDQAYEKISRRFMEHPDQFADASPAPGSS